ncbi:hypothetical protein B0H14DRAFT_3448683 [Mycena olivaceomarginata]|nr:hypothetical protein B0H14DRAFT_3448683 [Mycena olivaceomarginata]
MPVPTSDLQCGEAHTIAIPIIQPFHSLFSVQYDLTCRCRCWPTDNEIHGESVERAWAPFIRDPGKGKTSGVSAETKVSKAKL